MNGLRYARPSDISELLDLIDALQGPYRFLAGGTDLVLDLKHDKEPFDEKEREEIAIAGQQDILSYHTLERRIPQYWRIMYAIQNGDTKYLDQWSFEQHGKFVTRNWELP